MKPLSLRIKKIHPGLNPGKFLETGYQFLPGQEWAIPESVAKHWNRLAMTWNNLHKDQYMLNGALYRERRFGRLTYEEATGHIQRSENNSFFQSRNINAYAGGIDRVFPPMHGKTYHNKFLHYVIGNSLTHFQAIFGIHSPRWEITVHQFRIISTEDKEGLPTPEGIHRDGHKFISMHLIRRENMTGGISEIYNLNKEKIASITLEKPMDSLFIADEMALHAVTPIYTLSHGEDSYRNMLVIDYNLIKD